ncbi:MAG: ubiquinone/menaquinone biosynthesis C-methylase UbiE [Saprospiraceae bacterium]|jgi:ubiquinone/menaquinone biosynthesis C-methylase UbiE/DNA-binding transcriptional ArsR family regulator
MESLLKALKAAGEPTRLRLFSALSQCELTVTELVFLLGQSQPRISRHLKILVDAGLLQRYQEGSWVFHRVNDQETDRSIAREFIKLIDYSDPVLLADQVKIESIKQRNAQQAANYFKAQAKDWDTIRHLVGSDEQIEQAMLDCIKDTNIANMVDLGTGTGRILEIFAPRLTKGIGFDASLAMLNVARANLERNALHHCQVRRSDIRALPTPSSTIDLATLHQVLHYIDNPIAVIQEATRILKPGGDILIVDFAKHQHEFLRTEHAHRRLGFSQSEILFWCEHNNLALTSHQKVSDNNTKASLEVILWHLVKND